MRTKVAKSGVSSADNFSSRSSLAIASHDSAAEKMADMMATRTTSQSNNSHPSFPYVDPEAGPRSQLRSINKHNTVFRSSSDKDPVQNDNLSGVSQFIGNSTQRGKVLSAETRNYFEPRFGHDFSDIRIHNYPQANKAAENIQAKAFTHNKDIYFNKSQFSPESNRGRWLLAHELTHTLQDNDNVVNRSPLDNAASSESAGELTDKQGDQSNTPDSNESIVTVVSELESSIAADPEDKSGAIKARLTSLDPSTRMQVITSLRSRLPESSRTSLDKILSDLPATEAKDDVNEANNKQDMSAEKYDATADKQSEQLKQKEASSNTSASQSDRSESANKDVRSEKDKIKSGLEIQNKKDQANEKNNQKQKETSANKLGKDTSKNRSNTLAKDSKEADEDEKKKSDDGLQSLSELLTQNGNDEESDQTPGLSDTFDAGTELDLTAEQSDSQFDAEFGTETPDASVSGADNRQGIIQSAIENISQNSGEAKTKLAEQSGIALNQVRAQARQANGSAAALVKKGGEDLGNKFIKQREQLKQVVDAVGFQIDGQRDARHAEVDILQKAEKKAVKGVYSGHRNSVNKTVGDNISAAEKLRTRYGNMIHSRTAKQADTARRKGNSKAAVYPNTLRGVTIQNVIRSVAYKTEKKIKEKEPHMVQSVEKITAVIPQEFKVKGKEVLEGFDDNLPEILLEVDWQFGLLKDDISSQADEAYKQLTEAKNKFSEQLNILENTASIQLRSLLPQVQARIARARRSSIRGINRAKVKTYQEIDKKTHEAIEILQSTSDPDAQNAKAFVNEVNAWISAMADETNKSVSETVNGLAQQFSRAGAGTRQGVRKLAALVDTKLAEITKKRDDWTIRFVELVDKGYGASITHISKEFSKYRDKISEQLSPVVTKLQSEFKDTLNLNEAKIKEAVNTGLAENDKALKELNSAMNEAASDAAWHYDHPYLAAIGDVFSWIGKILLYIAGAIIAIAAVIILIVIVVVIAKVIVAAAAALAGFAGATAAVVATVKIVVGLIIAAGFIGYTAYSVHQLYQGYRAAGLGKGEALKNALKDISGISDIQQSFSDPDLSPFDRGYKFGRGAATLISSLIGGRKLIAKFRGNTPPKITNPAKPKGLKAKFNKSVEAIGTKATGRLDKYTARKIAENAKKSLPPSPAPIPQQLPPPVKQVTPAQTVPLPKTKPLAAGKPSATKKPKLELVVSNKKPIQAPSGGSANAKKPKLKLVESKPDVKKPITPEPRKPIKPVKAANDNALPAEQPNVVKLQVPQQKPMQAVVGGQQSQLQAAAGGGSNSPMGIRQNAPTTGVRQPGPVASTGGGTGKPSNQLSLPFKQPSPASVTKHPVAPLAGSVKQPSLSIVKPKSKSKGNSKFQRRTEPSKEALRASEQYPYRRSNKREYNKYRQEGGQLSMKEWLKSRGTLKKLGNDPELLGTQKTAQAKAGSNVHSKLPSLDANGKNVRGILKVGVEEVRLKPGEKGPGRWLVDNLKGGKGSGLTRAWTHVEGHVAGLMRRFNLRSAELFINAAPCGPGAAQCRFVIQKLIPPGSKLKVHFPDSVSGQTKTWLFEGGVEGWKVIQ